jgi:hypothetical protein
MGGEKLKNKPHNALKAPRASRTELVDQLDNSAALTVGIPHIGHLHHTATHYAPTEHRYCNKHEQTFQHLR